MNDGLRISNIDNIEVCRRRGLKVNAGKRHGC